ncbi:hypothetical protein E1180_21550 [Roseibium denhamense]|uniref:Uncharacterized protein n=1 Tax=Roseibium denhamense TaxID=76305 RepID=A0ABY1NRK5_9HYPH|nr:hypothetical protein [Roseibium denhamense]MTI08089.1 hypothetical protein [Roseibium denhamense]SMP16164.1 hypothetical protein SAMN06265374_1681 [Roseibium denhamense]
MSEYQLIDFTWQEYKTILEIYEGFNSQYLTIKGWSVTVCLAAIFAAYSKPVARNGRIALIVASLGAFSFFLAEVSIRTFQKAYLFHLKSLEALMVERGHGDLFQAMTGWELGYFGEIKRAESACFSLDNPLFGLPLKYESYICAATDLHVLLPHFLIIGLGLVLAYKWPPTELQNRNHRWRPRQ